LPAAIIIVATADESEPRLFVKPKGMISFADFKMNACRAPGGRLVFEVFEQNSSDPAASAGGLYSKQQQFGLVCDNPGQREAEHRLIVAREGQPDAGERQQAGALRQRPGFA